MSALQHKVICALSNMYPAGTGFRTTDPGVSGLLNQMSFEHT